MALKEKCRNASNSSFPNVNESYEVKFSKSELIADGKFFLVTFKGKRLSDGKDGIEHATIFAKPFEIEAGEENEVLMINTSVREGKAYPKITFPD